MAEPGPAGGGGAEPGLEAALGRAGVSVSVRPRRKLPTAEEAELFELAQAAGIGLDPEVFRTVLDLLRMNVAPLAVFQTLKSMCAGQRLGPSGPESGPGPESRGQEPGEWGPGPSPIRGPGGKQPSSSRVGCRVWFGCTSSDGE
uniref:Mitotic-spindle organizing protein 2B n=1 Tax=Pelusios castaneus TaxID=367368 RepID=A0A8C8RZN4_9SAUR